MPPKASWDGRASPTFKRCLAPHDVLIEAVNLVLQRYGRPTVAELADKRLNVVTL